MIDLTAMTDDELCDLVRVILTRQTVGVAPNRCSPADEEELWQVNQEFRRRDGRTA